MSGLSPFAMLIFSSLGVIITGLIFQLLGIVLATLIYDVSITDLLQSGDNPDQSLINAFKLVQIIGAIGSFIISSLLLSFIYTGKWLGYFPFRRLSDFKPVILIIVIMIAALPFVNFLTDVNQRFELPLSGVEHYLRQMEAQTEKLMMTLIRADNLGALMVNLFMIALIPAIGEELVFRGLIQRHLSDWFRNPHVAIIVASAIFSLVHLQVYSFLPRFFLGLVLGYTFHYGRSIWYPIIAHLVNNTLGVLFYYFYMKELTDDSLEEIGTMEMMPAAALMSLILVAALLYIWVKTVSIKQRESG